MKAVLAVVLGCFLNLGSVYGGASSGDAEWDGWDYKLDSRLCEKDETNCCGGTTYESSTEYKLGRCGPNNWWYLSDQEDDTNYCKYHPNNPSESYHNQYQQSPVKIKKFKLYLPHGIDELKFDIQNEEGCKKAVTKITQSTIKTTYDQLYCSGTYDMTFRYYDDLVSYYVKKFDFRYPAEHVVYAGTKDSYSTVEDPENTMEAQFHFETADGSGKMAIAVLMHAHADNHPNDFFNTILEVAAGSDEGSTHTFKYGQLNFVDNFLPSSGLKYDYYFYYYGSKTQPPCTKKVKWVVMQQPVRITPGQMSTYLNLIQNKYNASYSKLIPQGTGTYYQQIANASARVSGVVGDDASAKADKKAFDFMDSSGHVYDFQDDFAYMRICHNIFKTGTGLNVDVAIWSLFILIVFTVTFEVGTEHLEHHLKKHRTGHHMLAKVYRELSILGFVSFMVVAATKSCEVQVGTGDGDLKESHFVAFEYVHVLIFLVAVMYIIFSAVVLIITNWMGSRLDKVINLEGDDFKTAIEHQAQFPPMRFVKGFTDPNYRDMGFTSMYMDKAFVYCKNEWISFQNLPQDFDFLKYLKYYLSKNVIESLDLSMRTWIICLVFFIVMFKTCTLDKDIASGVFWMWGYIGLGVQCLALYCGYRSFNTLFSMYDITPENVDELLDMCTKETVGVNRSQAKRTTHSHLAEKLKQQEQSSDNILKRMKKQGKKIQARLEEQMETVKHSMHNLLERMDLGDDSNADGDKAKPSEFVMQHLQKKTKIEAMLQACWSPQIFPDFIYYVTESAPTVMCFYAGAFMLTYYDIMDNGGLDLLVIISILLGLFVTTPALLLRKTLLQCLTHADHKLIGEVSDYMEENRRMRKALISSLFPYMDQHLMDHISGQDILRIFEHFDDDQSYTIGRGEFVKGCEALGLHLSTHRLRRLLRMLDDDRSGTIDPEEIFVLLCEEKLTRIMEKVQLFFNRYSEPEGSNMLSAKLLPELLTRTYGKGFEIPEEAKKSAETALVSSLGTIDVKDFRNWIVKMIEADKDSVHAELDILRASQKPVPVGHPWYDPRGYLHRNVDASGSAVPDDTVDEEGTITPKQLAE